MTFGSILELKNAVINKVRVILLPRLWTCTAILQIIKLKISIFLYFYNMVASLRFFDFLKMIRLTWLWEVTEFLYYNWVKGSQLHLKFQVSPKFRPLLEKSLLVSPISLGALLNFDFFQPPFPSPFNSTPISITNGTLGPSKIKRMHWIHIFGRYRQKNR